MSCSHEGSTRTCIAAAAGAGAVHAAAGGRVVLLLPLLLHRQELLQQLVARRQRLLPARAEVIKKLTDLGFLSKNRSHQTIEVQRTKYSVA